MNLRRLTFVVLITMLLGNACFSQLSGNTVINSNEAYSKFYKYSLCDVKVPYSYDAAFRTLTSQEIFLSYNIPNRSGYAIIGELSDHIDFGPLFGSGNAPSGQEKLNYSRVWSVLGHDIKSHIRDFNADQKINSKIHSIYAWPARGNPYFEQCNGFKLQRMDYDLAPFYDFNKDGQYNPDDGDYPHIDQAKFNQIPSAIYFSIFHTNSSQRLELGLISWTYQCEENTLLNKAIFSSYKISNYSNADFINFKFCSKLNPDLGCLDDNYIGTHPSSNSCFWYNRSNLDGGEGAKCEFSNSGFGFNPPAQFFSYLNQPMSSCAFMHAMDMGNGMDSSYVSNRLQHSNYINGYRNGNLEFIDPKTNLPTLFPYNGDVTDPNGWSMFQEKYKWPSNFRLYPTCNLGNLLKGKSVRVDLVLHNSRVLNADHLQNVKFGIEQVNKIKELYLNSFEGFCSNEICLNECVWPGDTDNNGIVDYRDAIQIFKSINNVGSMRPYPYVWAGTSATPWPQNVPNGVNHKYIDANGDGIITQNDVQLVTNHYLYFRGVPEQEPEDCTLGKDIVIKYYSDSVLKKSLFFIIEVIPGVKNIQGISFQLDVSDKDISFTFWNNHKMWKDSMKSNFWNSYIGFSVTGNKELKYGLVSFHSSGKNQPSLDTIRLKGLILSPNILKQNLDLRICNAKLWFEDGSVKNLYSNQLTFFSPNSVSVQNSELNEILFFPNPVSQQLFIQSNERIENLRIFDLYGSCFGYYTLPGSSIDVSHLSNGIYFVEARVGQKPSLQKISVINY